MCGHKKLSRREPSIFSFWAYLTKQNDPCFEQIIDYSVLIDNRHVTNQSHGHFNHMGISILLSGIQILVGPWLQSIWFEWAKASKWPRSRCVHEPVHFIPRMHICCAELSLHTSADKASSKMCVDANANLKSYRLTIVGRVKGVQNKNVSFNQFLLLAPPLPRVRGCHFNFSLRVPQPLVMPLTWALSYTCYMSNLRYMVSCNWLIVSADRQYVCCQSMAHHFYPDVQIELNSCES